MEPKPKMMASQLQCTTIFEYMLYLKGKKIKIKNNCLPELTLKKKWRQHFDVYPHLKLN